MQQKAKNTNGEKTNFSPSVNLYSVVPGLSKEEHVRLTYDKNVKEFSSISVERCELVELINKDLRFYHKMIPASYQIQHHLMIQLLYLTLHTFVTNSLFQKNLPKAAAANSDPLSHTFPFSITSFGYLLISYFFI
jgi:hypothetical protein